MTGMTLFWGLAVLLAVGCMALLLPPLLRRPAIHGDAGLDTAGTPPLLVRIYRDQLDELDAQLQAGQLTPQQYRQARDELERRLLDDVGHAAPAATGESATSAVPTASATKPTRATGPSPWLAALLLAAVPGVAVTLYLQLGNPLALMSADDMAARTNGQHDLSNAQVEGMVNQLAQRLRDMPDDAAGWHMLARSYAAMGRHADAAAAYARLVALVPDDATLRADYADVLGSVNGGSLQGAAAAQIDAALRLDGDDPKALALAASAAVERSDTAAAVGYWKRLQALLPPDSKTAARVAANLAAASASSTGIAGGSAAVGDAAVTSAATAAATDAADGATTTAPGADAGTAVTTAAGAVIAGRVSLADDLPRRPGADETVFVYARANDASRVPLAIIRRKVRDLPLSFTLDDAAAMRPDHRLSDASQVMLEARVSASGNAMPQPGDLVGQAGPMAPGQRDVTIVIGAPVAASSTPPSTSAAPASRAAP